MPDLDYIVEPLRSLAVPLDDLTLDPKNTRDHFDEDLAELAAELKISGQDQAILVQREGMVVRKGNGRVMAARQLGWTHIAAVVIDISEKDGVRRAVVDNRLAERSRWNNENLLEALEYLEREDILLKDVGFDDNFVAEILEESLSESLSARAESPDTEPTVWEEAQTEEIKREGAYKVALVFDSEPDRAVWIAWTKALATEYPDCETLGERLVRYCQENPNG